MNIEKTMMVYDLMAQAVMTITFICGLMFAPVVQLSYIPCGIGLFSVVSYFMCYGKFLGYCKSNTIDADVFKILCTAFGYISYLSLLVFLVCFTRGLFVL